MKPFIPALLLVCAYSPLQAGEISVHQPENYLISYNDGLQGSGRQSGYYHYAMATRSRWIALVREFPLGENFSAGLGMHLGGPEIEMRTTDSVVVSGSRSVDLNDWLSLRARLRFHDLVPYAQISYRAQSSKRGLAFRLDAGLRVLSVSDLALEIDGPALGEIEHRGEMLQALKRDARDDLESYYVEPLLRMKLNLRFG